MSLIGDFRAAQTPSPKRVVSRDGLQLATYEVGDPEAPVVLLVHGFASSAQANWFSTGWARELVRSGHRVVALDQRGHGLSDKPRSPEAYSIGHLVNDVETVLDTYLLDDVGLVGYSLGARVSWHAANRLEHRVSRVVLGGIPDGMPLRRFRVDQARGFLTQGGTVEDPLTRAYLDTAVRIARTDVAALIALVEGVQRGFQPDPDVPPRQPALFATGSDDPILQDSRRLTAQAPLGRFYEIPGRNHFNAPTSRAFRDMAIQFLDGDLVGERLPEADAPLPQRADEQATLWEAGLAALAFLDGIQAPPDTNRRLFLVEHWEQWLGAIDALHADAAAATSPSTAAADPARSR